MPTAKRILLLFSIAICLLALAGWRQSASADPADAPPRASNPFFAFANGVEPERLSLEEQARLLKQLGYDGIGWEGIEQIPEMLAALDRQGLKMFSVYVAASVDPGRPPYDPRLAEAIRQLKGRETLIWLQLGGGTPSASNADDRATVVVREIADLADSSGLRVALYPHLGAYVQTVEDALRLAKRVERGNLGVSFNLCHFLKLDREENLERRVKEALPRLFVVSINGADRGDTRQMGWERLIQTLDQGSFDTSGLLKLLRESRYAGPIGLQCYGVHGDPRDNLSRSMAAWRRLSVADAGNATPSGQ